MKICILNDVYLESNSPFSQVDTRVDPTPYLMGHQVEQVILVKKTAVAQVEALVVQNFDVFINLCDGAPDEDRPGIEVIQTLEAYGVAFTGANSGFYDPSRLQMKQACLDYGIPTPAYALITDPSQVITLTSHMEFPLIVKHPNSYGSIGLTKMSKVFDHFELQTQVQTMIDQFGAALVEVFISGKEYSVLVAENPDNFTQPVTFTPVEIQFASGETFKHFDLKWLNYETMRLAPCQDLNLAAHLRELSGNFFMALGGVSYGRCDLRVDKAGKPYMLEINPNCGLFYPPSDPGMADAILLQDPSTHAGFMELIIRAAKKRAASDNSKKAGDIL